MKYNIFILAILVAGCKSDVDAPKDTELPKITISSPTANQVFTSGQTVIVNAIVTDNAKLGEIHLEIINNNTSVLHTHEHYVPDGTSYTISRTFTLAAGASYKIKVDAEDDSDNKAETILNVTVN